MKRAFLILTLILLVSSLTATSNGSKGVAGTAQPNQNNTNNIGNQNPNNSSNNGSGSSEWSAWEKMSCYQGFQSKAQNLGYVASINQFSWKMNVKSNYSKRVHFNMYWIVGGEKQSIGRFSLNPGEETNGTSYYFNSNSSNWEVQIEKVCFGENYLSCGNCNAVCDNGTPNQPNCDSKSDKRDQSSNNTTTQESTNNRVSFEGNVYEKVDQMPIFPGGESQLINFVASHIQYPIVALENDIQGKVEVSFIVMSDGSISSIHIQKSVSPELDNEAIRIVSTFPHFIAGKQNGKNVNVRCSIPITFQLK